VLVAMAALIWVISLIAKRWEQPRIEDTPHSPAK